MDSKNSMSKNELGYTHTVSPGYRTDGRYWCEPRGIVLETTRRIHVVESTALLSNPMVHCTDGRAHKITSETPCVEM